MTTSWILQYSKTGKEAYKNYQQNSGPAENNSFKKNNNQKVI